MCLLKAWTLKWTSSGDERPRLGPELGYIQHVEEGTHVVVIA